MKRHVEQTAVKSRVRSKVTSDHHPARVAKDKEVINPKVPPMEPGDRGPTLAEMVKLNRSGSASPVISKAGAKPARNKQAVPTKVEPETRKGKVEPSTKTAKVKPTSSSRKSPKPKPKSAEPAGPSQPDQTSAPEADRATMPTPMKLKPGIKPPGKGPGVPPEASAAGTDPEADFDGHTPPGDLPGVVNGEVDGRASQASPTSSSRPDNDLDGRGLDPSVNDPTQLDQNPGVIVVPSNNRIGAHLGAQAPPPAPEDFRSGPSGADSVHPPPGRLPSDEIRPDSDSTRSSPPGVIGTGVNRPTSPDDSALANSDGPPPDPFDPARLRMSQDFAGSAGVKKLIVTIPVQKPSKEPFVRTHPDPAYRLATGVIELKEDRETYLVDPSLWGAMAGESTFVAKLLVTTVTRQGVLSLWPIRLPGPDGKIDEWNRSALEAADTARDHWTRVAANMGLGAYEIQIATGITAEPEFPDLPMKEILRIAFKGKYIDSLDHPVLRKLRGEV